MFLDTWRLTGYAVIAIPFVVLIGFVALFVVFYFVYLVMETLYYRSKLGLKDIEEIFISETTTVPNYEPAVMGYLINYQKIGRREICSTLMDLIGRNLIKITLKKGFVSDDTAEYVLEKNCGDQILKSYESLLITYLFGSKERITSKVLHNRLYKNNLKEGFYSKFLRLIQEDAKKHDFFDPKIAKIKMKVYKIVDKVVTILASIISGLCCFGIEGIEDVGDGADFILVFFICCLITAGTLWCMKFLISFMYNLNCYYNDFSKQGNNDYKKWIGFRKFLKNCSSIPNHPLMGVMVWERFYAYAIGLRCSKKFFKQMKKMKVVDNSIDIVVFEKFNDIVECIGTSAKKIKSVSLDEFGGSHVDY